MKVVVKSLGSGGRGGETLGQFWNTMPPRVGEKIVIDGRGRLVEEIEWRPADPPYERLDPIVWVY